MVNELINLLGLKNETDNDFKEMLDFPKTLFVIDVVAFLILITNDIFNFIQFNKLLTFSLYALVLGIAACAGVLYLKIKSDFKNIRKDINIKINEKYKDFYEHAKKFNIVDDININIDESKISRKLDFKCTQQEISNEMIKEFLSLIFQNKQDEIDRIKFPIENWDLYQIYGLQKAYITYNKATLYMDFKLPEINDELTESECEIISMYLNAMETLVKDNQIIRDKNIIKKKEEKDIPRSSKNINIYDGVTRGMVETEEDEIRKMLENDERFKGKDLSKVVDVINKMQKENKK